MCEIEPQLNFMRENRSQLKCFFFQVYQIWLHFCWNAGADLGFSRGGLGGFEKKCNTKKYTWSIFKNYVAKLIQFVLIIFLFNQALIKLGMIACLTISNETSQFLSKPI